MFNTVTIAAKRVRCGDVIKVAGKKHEVISTANFYGNEDVEIGFLASPKATRISTLVLHKNAPIKVHQK